MKEVKFSDLKEKVITKIIGAEKGEDQVIFECSDGTSYKMYHEQDCCEGVYLEDVIGDILDIIETPILSAEEYTNNEAIEGEMPDYVDDSFTWTFYHIATIKGFVTLRWYGSSNGYYSESVDFIQL